MDKDNIKILKFIENVKLKCNYQNFDRLAFVDVGYYGVNIHGYLMRGWNDKGKPFYFFQMPHILYKSKDRLKKINIVNFPGKEISDKFQTIVIDELIKLNPQLFHEKFALKPKIA